MYHSYPGDPTKFIQCNEWGSAQVLSCEPGYTWVPSYSTCVMDGEYGNGQMSQNTDTQSEQGGVSCTMPHLHFLPHPTDTSRYYECSQGFYQERQCLEKKLWDQGTKECRVMASSDDHYVSNVADLVPCSTPHLHFLPHPMDARMYLECIEDFYREQQCNKDKLWDQEAHGCKATGSTNSGSDGNGANGSYGDHGGSDEHYVANENGNGNFGTNGNSGSRGSYGNSGMTRSSGSDYSGDGATVPDYTGPNPCKRWEGYYYPMPDNDRCYIQCDETGGMHVMLCHPGLVWVQAYLNCLPRWMVKRA